MDQLSKADHFFDNPNDSPYWNESVWFSFSVPEQHIHGFIQYYFRPNMGMLNGGPVMWDRSGTNCWDCLYYNWSHLQAIPPGAEKFNMRANNSLSVSIVEPLSKYAISYDNDDFQLELQWQSVGPMHQLRSSDPGQRSTQKFHMEQPGRMRGVIRRDGRVIDVDCYSMRDASYGPRVYSESTGGYFWGIAQDSVFHAIAKGDGADQKVIGGFIWKNGELGSLTTGNRHIDEFGRFGPKRVTLEATDTLGRTIKAYGDIDDGLKFTGYTDHTVLWSLMRWEWDGVEHWGDNQEFCSTLRFRRIARGDIKLGSQ